MKSIGAIALAALLAWAAPAGAATLTVINTNDAGGGSLRECVEVANASSGPHRIVFAIPGAGVQTIHLASALPALINATSIDGTSQPGYNFVPLIEIDGTGSDVAITLTGAHSSVKGLVLNRFPDSALNVFADACTVSACYIGTNAAGTAPSANGIFGVYVTGDDVLIGGRIPAYRNVISGNNFLGVAFTDQADRDTVIGNHIGTDVTGTVAIPNSLWGVETGGSRGLVIDGNLISGNGADGIYVDANTIPLAQDAVRIYRNRIGTDESGMNALPNQENGIRLLEWYTQIGGVGLGNVISGNTLYGIYVSGNFSQANQIQGNKIGVSADGTRPLGNTLSGIRLAGSPANTIGGDKFDGSGNLIGANGAYGIEIDGETATDNLIFGNAIGTSFNGALALGNAETGIVTFSDRATIGGTGVLGNIIAHNQDGGIRVASVQNTIRGNAIFDNPLGLGIDLFDPGTGITLNDTLDDDQGSNHLQNFPVLTSVSVATNNVRLQGRLQSVPGHTFTLDFYSNRSCGTLGYGEGESWLGTTEVTTNTQGQAFFDVQYPLSSAVGYVFTGTATDDAGNTSEFSPCGPMGTPTAVDPSAGMGFALGLASPSPARGRTSLPFTLARPSHVTIRAYDVAGRLVRTLLDRELPAGANRVDWTFSSLGAGVYSCRLDARATDGSHERFEASRSVIVLP